MNRVLALLTPFVLFLFVANGAQAQTATPTPSPTPTPLPCSTADSIPFGYWEAESLTSPQVAISGTWANVADGGVNVIRTSTASSLYEFHYCGGWVLLHRLMGPNTSGDYGVSMSIGLVGNEGNSYAGSNCSGTSYSVYSNIYSSRIVQPLAFYLPRGKKYSFVKVCVLLSAASGRFLGLDAIQVLETDSVYLPTAVITPTAGTGTPTATPIPPQVIFVPYVATQLPQTPEYSFEVTAEVDGQTISTRVDYSISAGETVTNVLLMSLVGMFFVAIVIFMWGKK